MIDLRDEGQKMRNAKDVFQVNEPKKVSHHLFEAFLFVYLILQASMLLS